MEENNNVAVKQERTTGEVNAEYKSRAPKFHEKIDALVIPKTWWLLPGKRSPSQ